jgi:DNA-binding transcriptional LysR family regulator
MAQFVRGDEAELSVGGSTISCTYLLPRIIRHVIATAPTLAVRTRQGDSRDVMQLLVREEVEVAVVGSLADNDTLTFQPLARDLIRLVVGRDHPWYGVRSLSLDDLPTEPLILREEGSGTGKAVYEALHKGGLNPQTLRVRAWMGSSEAVKQSVLLGIGAAFLSDLSVRSELERGELSAIELNGIDLERTFYLAYRRGRELSPAAKVFCDAAREAFPPVGD